MRLNPAPHEGEPAIRREPERTGIRGRVEAASRMRAPAPKGKGIAMLLLGAAVLAALIWDFTMGSAPSRRVREAANNRGEVVTAPPAPGEGVELTLTHEGAQLTLSASAAVAFFVSAPAEKQAELRPQLLSALAGRGAYRGRSGREAFELAIRLLDGATAASLDAIADLTLEAHGALDDDGAAPAAILFLARLPDGVDRLSARALDKVILDHGRPLHVRLAAARARPPGGRPEALDALAADGTTHPALRDALR